MTEDQRDVRRKQRVREPADHIGKDSKTGRSFGVGRARIYRWRDADRRAGEAGLVNRRSVPNDHPNKTPKAVAEKVLYLWRRCHLGPMRIVW